MTNCPYNKNNTQPFQNQTNKKTNAKKKKKKKKTSLKAHNNKKAYKKKRTTTTTTITTTKKTKQTNKRKKKQKENKIIQLLTEAPELVTLDCSWTVTVAGVAWTGVICEAVTPHRQDHARSNPLALLLQN